VSTTPRAVGEHFDGDLRGVLLAAAVERLDEVGPERLSLREVARRAGVSHAAPAHHFGDRAGLLTAVATEGFVLFDRHLTKALAGSRATPVAQLPLLARAYADFAARHPGHFAVMFRPALLRSDDPDLVAAGDAAFQTLHAHVERCQRAGWRPDVDGRLLATASWALAHGITVLRTHGSLARHGPGTSLAGVAALANALIGDVGNTTAYRRDHR
jgi:AcrR family transcriptional regulator